MLLVGAVWFSELLHTAAGKSFCVVDDAGVMNFMGNVGSVIDFSLILWDCALHEG